MSTSSHPNLFLLATVIHQNFSNPSFVLSNLKDLVLLPSKVVQYPVLLATPMSTVAISVPSFTIFTLCALSPFIVVSSLFVVGINSCRKGGYPYPLFPSIMNYNIASCNLLFPNFKKRCKLQPY